MSDLTKGTTQSLLITNEVKAGNSFLIKTVISFVMITLFLICLIFSNQTDKLVFALIPLAYIIGFIFILELYKYIDTPAMLVINVLYLIRYYILPILTLFDERVGYISQYYNGVLFLLYEEVAVIVAFAMFLPSFRKKKAIKIS